MTRRAGIWQVDIDGSETKTGRPHAALIPPEIGAFLDYYLSLSIRRGVTETTGVRVLNGSEKTLNAGSTLCWRPSPRAP
jgi:hypothetical protein